MEKSKLLCSAQTFGFGPISKLYSVARLLKEDFSLILVLDSKRNVFSKINPGIFEDIIYAPKLENLEAIIREKSPNAILSVYEPDIVLAAKRTGVPSYFIDGLFWFWELRTAMAQLNEQANKLIAAQTIDLDKILRQFTPHERIFTSHFLASKSYIQYDPNISARFEDVKKYMRAELVGAIINNSSLNKETSENHVLVTLSGEILPTVSLDQSAMYAQLIINMVSEASNKYFKDKKWIVLVNPLVLPKLNTVGKSNVSVRDSVDQTTMYNLQRNAIVVFSPPGLTTIYECASLGKPVIFLPEQSVQYKNAYRLKNYGFPVLGGFFQDINGQDDQNADGLTILYAKTIPLFLINYSSIFERVFSCCKDMENSAYRQNITMGQMHAVIKMVGTLDGANQIASDLKRELL